MKAIVCSLAVVAVLLACQFSRAQPLPPARDGRTLSEWTERTKARDDAVLQEAVIAIGKLGPDAKAALPANVLDDKYWYGHEAVQALDRIGPDARIAFPPLIEMLERAEVRNRYATANALNKIRPGSKASPVALAEAALDDNGDVREAAIVALISLGAEANAAVPVLVKHVNSNEPVKYWEARYAIRALGKIGPTAKEAVPALVELLKSRGWAQEVFDALTEIGPAASSVLPQLVVALRDRVWLPSEAKEKDRPAPTRKECETLVLQWMRDDEPATRTDGNRLWKLLAAEDLPLIAPMLTSDAPRERALAFDKLFALGESAVPALNSLVKSGDPDTRRTAMHILGQIGPAAKSAVPILATTLKERDSHVCSAAAIALGQFGANSAPAVAALTESLKDMDGDERVCAIEALGRIGPAAAPAAAELIERLHDKIPMVRSVAARALGKIGTGAKAAVPELEKLGSDREDYVRQAAEEAVKAISHEADKKAK